VEQVAQSAAAGGAVQSPAAADYTPEPMSGIRKTIARRLVQSKQEIPHYYLTADLPIEGLLTRRAALNAQGIEASINDLIVHAAALALMDVPEVNANLVGDEIRRFAHADVAVAVATDDGLAAWKEQISRAARLPYPISVCLISASSPRSSIRRRWRSSRSAPRSHGSRSTTVSRLRSPK